MNKKSDLVEKKCSQFNCAQTVFSLFAKDLGLDKTTAIRIACGFGGGMNCLPHFGGTLLNFKNNNYEMQCRTD
jgi:hypothetical protein